MKSIGMLLTRNFIQHVGREVDPRPAYGGESAAMDLYNAGPEIIVPPLTPGDLNDWIADLSANARDALTWDDIPIGLRKTNYKILMPTGVKIVLPHDHVGLVRERSYVTKTPLIARAGVIDAGYAGEIFVNMVNLSPRPYVIGAGAKSPFQLLAVQISNQYQLLTQDEFDQMHANSSRGAGCIGSSDR